MFLVICILFVLKGFQKKFIQSSTLIISLLNKKTVPTQTTIEEVLWPNVTDAVDEVMEFDDNIKENFDNFKFTVRI